MDALLDHAPCGFLSFADDGTIELVNATLLAMLGYEREEVVGRHVETILTVGGRIFYQTHLFPLLALHGHAEEIFLLLQPKGGGDAGALVNAVRRKRDDRFVIDCVLMHVRERRKFEDALLQARKAAETANRAKSEFLAVMSHELRTPLNAIAGYAQLLEIGVHGPITDDQREALDRIVRSQRLLLRLINDVLNLARIEAGRVDYRIADLSISEVVAAVTPMIEPQLGAKGIACESDIDPTLCVRADREKVEQIILNLLTNATKFTPSGGRVSVRALLRSERPDAVFLEVADTGVGIPADMQSEIFQPFVQVDTSPSRATEGSGLGLTISRDLARGMGGDLSVVSTVGVGSTFTLRLPRSPG